MHVVLSLATRMHWITWT